MADTTTASPFTPEMIAATFGEQPASAPEPPKADEAKPANDNVGEAAKDHEADAKSKGVADRITAAKRVQQRVERERAEFEAKKRELDAREAAQKAKEEEQRLFEEDPVAYAAKKGWGPKEYAAHLEKLAGTSKPEAIADRKLSAVEQELADLKAKLAAKEKAEAEAALSATQRSARDEAAKAFIADIAASVDKYPHLVQEFDEETAVREGFAALNQVIGHDGEGKPVTRIAAFARDNGRPPTHDEIAEYLDGIAKTRIEARGKSAWRKQGDAPAIGSQPSLGESKPSPPVNKGTSPRTLSRADASQRATAPVNAKWSQKEADEQSLRIFEKMMAKG